MLRTQWQQLAALSITLASLGLLSCSSAATDPTAAGANPLVVETNLLFEGTCNFLACCSCWATAHTEQVSGTYECHDFKGCPTMKCDPRQAGTYYAPSFYCKSDDTACNDNDLWLVKPQLTSVDCGKRYLICYKGQALEVPIKDKSDKNNRWEASQGVFGLLGLKAGDNPAVKIYSNPDDPAVEKDPECNCEVPCLKNLLRRCGGKGTCTLEIDSGNPSKAFQSYPNGIRAEGEFTGTWASALVYKYDVPCYHISQVDGADGSHTVFTDPAGKTIADLRIAGDAGTFTCDGKSTTVKMSTVKCAQSLFLTGCF